MRMRNSAFPPRRTRRSELGMTLIEVMFAVLIVGMTATFLLDQRLDVVQKAGAIREARTAYLLLSRKMAELELDPEVMQAGSQGSGDFSEYGHDYEKYQYGYQVDLMEVATHDPEKEQEEPREIIKLTLTVESPSPDAESLSLAGFFAVSEEEQPEQPENP